MRQRRHVYSLAVAAVLALVGFAALAYGIWLRPGGDGHDVLRIAYGFKEGGGYGTQQTGVPQAIVFNGTTILAASKDTNCSGFTFAVAMRAAQDRGLLQKCQPAQLKRFQKQWYGAVRGSEVKTLVTAMENLGIGKEVYPMDARPGDFVQFWGGKTGHSAIFLEWIKRDGEVVGLKYRSSQPATSGIGDHSGYFTTSGTSVGVIEPEKFFVGRLNG